MNVEFVAEFTTNHMGNLNVLLRMVEMAADAGASYIKMQKKDVENFYDEKKLSSEFLSPYGKNYRDYRTIFEFNDDDYTRFDNHCKKHNIEWFTTIQDINSLYWMLKYDLNIYKVASYNSNNKELLNEIKKSVPTHKRLVVSLAGRTLKEIENVVNMFSEYNLTLLHCVAEYPCQVENLRLGNITELIKHFNNDKITIGYSGHELGIRPSLAAISLGAKMVERHFCLSRHSFVHHIECSLEPDEFKNMINITKNNNDLKKYWEKYLPPIALEHHFGMTAKEKSFLIDNTYGNQFITQKNGSTFK